jgi:hypothetical protein
MNQTDVFFLSKKITYKYPLDVLDTDETIDSKYHLSKKYFHKSILN